MGNRCFFCGLCLCLLFGAFAAEPKLKGRAVVLGFDGLDAGLAEKWMRAGELPHFSRLAEQGCFRPLATSNPAQSPVAWSTFATGRNPGEHNIFGFLKPDGNYRPCLALGRSESKPFLGGRLGKAGIALAAGFLAGLSLLLFFRFLGRPSVRKARFFAATVALVASLALGWMLISWVPDEIPWPESAKDGTSFWTLAAQAGIETAVVGAPISFPAESVPEGRLLCGFGTPDLAGTNGLWFRYSADFPETTPTETGGWKIRLTQKDGGWEGTIPGPRNLLAEEESKRLRRDLEKASSTVRRERQNRLVALRKRMRLACDFRVEPADGGIQLVLEGKRHSVAEGKWSEWLTVRFRMSPLVALDGMARMRVLRSEPPELYLTPVQFHPFHLPFNVRISDPSDFAADLAEENGLFPTLGWSEPTNALKDGCLTEEAFWEDLEYTMARTQEVFLSCLSNRPGARLIAGFFYVPDRASHMYWRFLDPEHPDFAALPEFRGKLLEVYRWADRVVGEVQSRLGENDMLIVLSDHGFAPFRQGVNLNTWLLQNGYLALKGGEYEPASVIDLYDPENLELQMDWSRTRAYALGLGKIYLNLRGREPQGIVDPETSRALCEEIRQKLSGLTRGAEKVVEAVYLREEIYRGPHLGEAPEIVVGFARNYRISWQTSMGSVPPDLFEPNDQKWSGDHCSVDPSLIPGILLCNRPVDLEFPNLLDLAPSILDLFGIPSDMEGRILFR